MFTKRAAIVFFLGPRKPLHTIKFFNDFPVPRRDVNNGSLRENLVSSIPAGDGKIDNLFLQCNHMDRQARAGDTVLVTSREMTCRSQTLPWGEEG